MFLVLTKRNDVFQRWSDLLAGRRGEVQRRANVAEALELSESTCISLTVIDFALIAATLDNGELQRLAKRSRILLINAQLPAAQELHVLSLGIVGCCATDLSQSELEKITDVILKGGIWVSRTALPDLFRQLGSDAAAVARTPGASGSDGLLDQLTPREREPSALPALVRKHKTSPAPLAALRLSELC